MRYTLAQLKDVLNEKVFLVYDTFKMFFGETEVDLQGLATDTWVITALIGALGHNLSSEEEFELSQTQFDHIFHSAYNRWKPFILVHWDRVTITNENDKSVEIQELYAKIGISLEGTIPYENHGFLLNRARYSKLQFKSNYMHSHVCSIPKRNFAEFQAPCLGRGPIRDTISSLKNDYDEALWLLFCQELAMYVTVESIAGVPYHRLEEIGSKDKSNLFRGFSSTDNYLYYSEVVTHFNRLLNLGGEFIPYYLEHGHLLFGFNKGMFDIGMSYYDYIIDISNAFIEWYNKSEFCCNSTTSELYSKYILVKVIAADNKFTIPTEGLQDADIYRGKFVCTFKGQPVSLQIDEEAQMDECTLTTLLHHDIAIHILKNILKVLNFRYKNEYTHSRSTGNNQATVASTYQNVRYF